MREVKKMELELSVLPTRVFIAVNSPETTSKVKANISGRMDALMTAIGIKTT